MRNVGSRRRTSCILSTLGVLATVTAGGLSAQTIETVTFDEAVRRAIASNPTVQQAAAGILRAEAIALQVRSRSLPTIDAALTTNVIDPITRFSGSAITPRTQTVTTADMFVPALRAGAVGGTQPGGRPGARVTARRRRRAPARLESRRERRTLRSSPCSRCWS